MRRPLLILFSFFALAVTLHGQSISLTSPGGRLNVDIIPGQTLSWRLAVDGREFFSAKSIDLVIDKKSHTFDNPHICEYFGQKYNGLRLTFDNGLILDLRLFDNGFAYRWITTFPGTLEITGEVLQLDFKPDYLSFFPQEKKLVSHYERSYKQLTVKEIEPGAFASLPVLFKSDFASVLVSEADLYDYPNMFLQKDTSGIRAIFPHYVLETKPAAIRSDRNQVIVREAGYIARTSGKRVFPWRVFMIARQDKDLLANNLVFDLSRTNPYDWDFSWVKPGKVAWDWWNARQLEGVDFKPGINTQTYKYYIDFAARFGLQYVILDEGWSRTTWDLLHFKPEIDVKELIRYGREKGVGVILWVLWNPLNQNMEQVLDSFAAWGAKGIKVDFMQRADQEMVRFYERTAREAAKRHLVVDFHGAYKPAGLRRAYPNVLSYEGVKGAEHNKWSKAITPRHNVILPFVRNVVGPMDYTPGGMRNVTREQFSISWKHPRVMGTRAHQVAMYVVYYSPLQMLADSPTEYEKNIATTKYIARIPTVWDETVPLDGKVGEYVAVARRYGRNWYIGVMNGEEPRTLQIKLDFLPGNKKYKAEIFRDTKQSAEQPTSYEIVTKTVDNTTVLDITMPYGGGYATILTPLE